MKCRLSAGIVASVMAMTLSVTSTAHADEAPTVPTLAPPSVPTPTAPATPVAAAPASPVAAAPAPPTVAAPAPPRVTPVPSPTAAAASPPAQAVAPPAAPAPAAQPSAPAAATAAPAELPLALRPATKPLTLASEPAPTPWPYKIIFGVAVVAACGLVWRKRRGLLAKRGVTATPVRVLGKTSMGLRGELALVEVGGMRLLVGVTPSSMQTLAILPDDFAEATAEMSAMDMAMNDVEPERPAPRESRAVPSRRAAEKDKSDLASRARALFSTLDVGPPIPARVAASGFAASRYADERDSDSAPDSAPSQSTRSREADRDRDRDRRRRPAARDAARDAPLEGQARGIALALGSRK